MPNYLGVLFAVACLFVIGAATVYVGHHVSNGCADLGAVKFCGQIIK